MTAPTVGPKEEWARGVVFSDEVVRDSALNTPRPISLQVPLFDLGDDELAALSGSIDSFTDIGNVIDPGEERVESDARSLTTEEETALWQTDPACAFLTWNRSKRVAARRFGAHSMAQYTSMFGIFLRWLAKPSIAAAAPAAPVALLDVKSAHIEDFLSGKAGRASRKGSSASITTRRRYLYLIWGAFNRLVELGLCTTNPAQVLLDASRGSDFIRPAPMILSMDQMASYITAVSRVREETWSDSRDKAMRLLFLASGITVFELRRLGRGDITWSGSPRSMLLRIAAHGFVLERLVPVAGFAHEAVLGWVDRLSGLAPGIERLFPARFFGLNVDRPKNAAISAPECYLIVQATLTAIGYRNARQGPQTLRNSFVARQLWSGRDSTTITRWLGLHTNETVNKISRLVPLRRDAAGPV